MKRLSKPIRHERFDRELHLMASLSELGSRVPPILDYDLNDRRPWFVMPWYPQGSLEDNLGDDNLSVLDRLGLAAELTAVLESVHVEGVAHRDLKPANVLLDSDGLLLADFGLSRTDMDDRLTVSWEAVGSRYYLAPENESGINEEVDQRPCDLYALGKIIWVVLTARRPLPRERQLEPGSRLAGILDERLSGLDELLARMLNTDPRARLTDLATVRDELASTQRTLGRTDSSGTSGVNDVNTLRAITALKSIASSADAASARRARTGKLRMQNELVPQMRQMTLEKFVATFDEFAVQLSAVAEGFTFSTAAAGTNARAIPQILGLTEDVAPLQFQGGNSVGSLIATNSTGLGMRGELWASIYPIMIGPTQFRLARLLHLIDREPPLGNGDSRSVFIATRDGSVPKITERFAEVGLPSADILVDDFIAESYGPMCQVITRYVELTADGADFSRLASELGRHATS